MPRPGVAIHRLLVLLTVYAALGCAEALASPGDIDPTFSDDGFAISSLGDETDAQGAGAQALAIAPDGKVVVAIGVEYQYGCGPTWGCVTRVEPAVARFNPDGSLDPNLAGDGEVEDTALPTEGDFAFVEVSDVAVQQDGKIILVGSESGHRQFWVARLTTEGSPDPSFGGGDGAVQLDLLGGDYPATDQANAVALTPDGRIVVVGKSAIRDNAPDQFSIARLLSDGSLDPSFSGDGWLSRSEPAADIQGLVDVAVEPSGRVVAVGGAYPTTRGIAVLAYTADGTPDPSFSEDGVAEVGIGEFLRASAMAIGPQDRILILGQRDSYDTDPVLIGLTSVGALDRDFGDGGFASPDPPGLPGLIGPPEISEVAVDGQSRPHVAGGFGATLVGRFTAAGRLDQTFSDNGWSPAFLRKRSSGVSDLAVAQDGIFVAGGSGHPIVAKRGEAEGPTDTDGDGVLNEAEACPYVFGRCPRIARRISPLKYKHTDGGWGLRGRLISSDNNCKWRRTVRVFRKRPGHDRKIALVRSKYGGIHVDGRFRRGRFYATSKQRLVAYGVCPAVRSPLLRLR